jgi:tyrocidine synthetase-3
MSIKKTQDQLAVAASQRLKEKRYWMENLSALPGKYFFPYDHTKKPGDDRDMREESFEFSVQLSSGSIKLSSGSDVRLHMILAAGVTALLYRYIRDYTEDDDGLISADGCTDVVTGIPILRPDAAETGNREGDFINTVLVLRNRLKPRMSFKELLLDMKQTVSKAVEHRNYPLEIIAQQLNMNYSREEDFPLFDVTVLLENIHDKVHIRHLNVNMEFSFIRSDSSLQVCIRYNRLLYKKSTIGRIVSMYSQLLESALGNVDLALEDVEVLSASERQQLLEEFNRREQVYPGDKTLHGLFEEQADRTPKEIAVKDTDETGQLTYGELNRKAGQLAAVLKSMGVEPGSIVGLIVERSGDMIAAILGILKSGAAYLPINPKNPMSRKTYLLRDSHVRFLVTHRELGRDIAALCEIVRLDDENLFPPDTGAQNYLDSAEAVTGPDAVGNLAYIIYTSGSTGNPKGVMLTHSNVCPLMHWGWRYFGITPDDRMIQNLSYYFDWSVSEIFMSLTGGACLHMISDEVLKNPELHVEFINRNRITLLNVTPTQCHYLFGVGVGMPYLRHLAIGAESLSVDLVKRALEIVSPGCRIHNLYGPTETTVTTTAQEIDRKVLHSYETFSGVPIGKPMVNLGILILNNRDDLCPVGVAGELYIYGDGVARGYLNRPELTAEKFISLPFTHHPSPLYRTGDRARWLADGTIEFLGRVDYQVKIRGFRIEPGEIEKQMLSHPSIKEVLVLAREYESGERYLCAYIVPGSGDNKTLEVQKLREYLSADLPDYMIPQYFMLLEKMPLNPNGKVDRKALPEPDIEIAGENYTAPGTEVEERLAAIWSEVLGIEQRHIGIDHDFFHLGGHSLKATTLVYRVYQTLEVNLEIEDVFVHPTIRELAQRIGQLEREDYAEIEPVDEQEHYELSFAQRRLWILCQFEEDSTAYNMPGAIVLRGDFNADVFGQAVNALADRHESLRTVFIRVEGDPRQKVLGDLSVRLEQSDLRNLPEADREEAARQVFRRDAGTAFNLEEGPLFRFNVLRTDDKEYVLIFNIHHIVTDGWSQGIITNEVVILYNAFLRESANPLPPLKLQYKDYTCWHNRLFRSDRFLRSRSYWLEKFKDKPNGIELPFDHPRRPVQTFNGGKVSFRIDRQQTSRLHELSLQQDATLFMSLLALVNVLLYRYSGQRDIMVGAPIAARKYPELHHMVGFLVNTLVYRNTLEPDQPFAHLLGQLKQEALSCYEFQDYPFDLLVEQLDLDRDLSQSPLFNVMLAHNNAETENLQLAMEGVTVDEYPHRDDFNLSKFDLIFFMDERDGEVLTRLEYNSDLFERVTARRMADSFLTLVDSVIRRTDDPVSGLDILSSTMREEVIRDFNNTAHEFLPLSLQEMFQQRVERCKDCKAVVYEEEFLTYGDLNSGANRLAHYLRNRYGLKPNHIVGISMDRSIDMVVVLLGVVKSGAAYLALDPNYPRERVLHVLADSRCDLLIVDRVRPELLEDYEGSILDVGEAGIGWQEMAGESGENPAVLNQANDILYVNYTSGSTGTPNGAMLSHDCLTNLIRWQNEESGIDGSLRCLQFTSINFCVSFQEIMGTLTCGGELYLIGDIQRQDIDYLMNFLSRHRIENLYLPFSYLNFLFNESSRWNQAFEHSLKNIITAGEQLKITAGLKRFLDLNPHLKLHNHYGSTEMHVVTSYTLDSSTALRYQRPVPVGVFGELYVAGSSEILGYINNESLNREKLVEHAQLSAETGGMKLYRSGDLGRWLPDGNIELKGRKDVQVKIRGFRVEPGEIESKLLSLEQVSSCVVVVKEEPDTGRKYLAAYVVLEGIGVREVKRLLSGQLPQYMMPRLVVLDALPLMPNGKVDRDRLPEPEEIGGGRGLDSSDNYLPPTNEVERELVEIWAGLLGLEEETIGIEDNFFERGGHSLKATTMMSLIHKKLNVKIELVEIFKHPFIRDIARRIKEHVQQGFLSVEAVEKRSYYPVSSAQKRLYLLQQFDRESRAYNIPAVMVLQGQLDEEKLGRVFLALIDRHESLRTSFKMKDGEPVQRVHEFKEVSFEIEHYSKSLLRRAENREHGGQGKQQIAPGSTLYAGFINHFIRSFDLEQAPLLRVGLGVVEESEGREHLLMVDMHHIVSDGVSLGVLVREFMALYHGDELPALRVQYKDYTLWQHSELEQQRLKKQETYWLKQFEGEIPVLNLPLDYPRPPVQQFEGDSAGFVLGSGETAVLKEFAAYEDATLYMVLLAVTAVFFSKLGGQEEVIMGTPVAGRSHADLESVIGMFVNTLALRTYPRGDLSMRRFLQQIKTMAMEAFDHQDYPFEELVEQVAVNRDTARNPLFDVMFTLQNMDIPELHIPGLTLKPVDFESKVSKFDMTVTTMETKKDNAACLHVYFVYSTALFKKGTVERFMNYYQAVVHALIDDPEQPISGIEIITPEEKEQVLYRFNTPEPGFSQRKPLHLLFEEQVKKTPRSTAVIEIKLTTPGRVDETEQESVTFAVLDEKANRLAHYLHSQGVRPGGLVGIMIERSVEMIIAILAILKTGCGYVPVNPKEPVERVGFILEECNVKILLTRAHLLEGQPYFDRCRCIVEYHDYPGMPVEPVNVDRGPAAVMENIAYIIFTSGSTGKPKGVPITHANISPLMYWAYKSMAITPHERVMQNLSYHFDWSVSEIFITFTSGAGLYMLPDEILLNPEESVRFINRAGITVLHVTPTQWQYLVNVGKPVKSLNYLFIGAEKLTYDLVQRSYRLLGTGCRVFNLYGPTEATITATMQEIDPNRMDEYKRLSSVPIGIPAANLQLYILDNHGSLCPVSLVGELYIFGDGVASGYLNRPELTAEKFGSLNKSYMSYKSDKTYTNKANLYRTGDLARWLPDGAIEFLGRIDHQVKIRGHRIELGEIENRLLTHPGVNEVAVIDREDSAGERYLCAYVVPAAGTGIEDAELRDYLQKKLPAYMVPAAFVSLPELPLNPNGKIDRKALPAPSVDAGTIYAAPTNQTEERLLKIWEEELAKDARSIGIDDNFFALGGHSLKATRLLARIGSEFGVDIPLKEMFMKPTIRVLAKLVGQSEKIVYTTIEPVENRDVYELSYAQRRLWVLCQFEEDSTAYNMPGASVVSGPFNEDAFRRAVETLLQRHESLRTVFRVVEGEPVQHILPSVETDRVIRGEDIRHLHGEEKEEQARDIYLDYANMTFDLENGPLAVFALIRLEEEKRLLAYNIHHIINDGWSTGVITNEIIRFYNAFSRGMEEPLEAEDVQLQYKDYARWHNRLIGSDFFAEAQRYWLEKFKDRPNGIELPLDRARQPVQTFNGGRVSFVLDEARTTGLYRLGREENTTYFMALLALVDLLLYNYTGQRDVIIGSPIAGRKKPELRHMMGFLVNTLVYRTGVDPGKDFRTLLGRVKEDALACYEYQDYPFDLLIERLELDRDLSQSPLFNVMLAHNNADTVDRQLGLEGISLSPYRYGGDFNMSKFDLTFFMDEVGTETRVNIEYNSDLFDRSTVQRMADNVLVLVDSILADPSVPVFTLDYIDPDQYRTVMERMNDTAAAFPGATLQEMFEKQAARTPGATAVVDNGKSVTYKQLNERANRLANYLREEYRVQPNRIVGVAVDRSIEMIVAILGTIKSGAGYLSIDPNYPEERVLHMLEDSGADIMLIDEQRPRLFAGYSGKMIDIKEEWETIAPYSAENPAKVNKPADTVYVIYTSGSTGIPNGAMLSHGILANLVHWQREKTSIDSSKRCLQFTSINFCVSFQEIMTTLTCGGELYLIGDIQRQDIEYLMNFLSSREIEILYLPFSYLNFLSGELGLRGAGFKHNLKHIITAGEQLKISTGLGRFLEQNPHIKLHNHYGSSEMHVVTYYTLDASTAASTPVPPAGKPVSNTRIFILDEHYRPVPVGVWGELCIAGSWEVSGYINNTSLTEQKLLKASFLPEGDKRLYLSGDIGRWREDGNIELQGRKDAQVKVRGFRVDPGEIESKLLAVTGVKDCVVVVKKDAKDQNYLTAYVVAEGIDAVLLKQVIAKRLPRHMIPLLVLLDKLPLMPNGKVDRDSLPEPRTAEPEDYVPPRNRTDEQLARIWQQLLETEAFGIRHDFFETGGHSLMVQKLINAIHKTFNVKLSFQDIFQYPTIAELSDLIRANALTGHVQIEALPEREYYELSYAQQRMWYLCKADPSSPAFNLGGSLGLPGSMDKEAVKKAFAALTRRHESFRTRFLQRGGQLVQVIEPRVSFSLENIDLSHLDEEDAAVKVAGFIREHRNRPFDLRTAPLFRVALVKCRGDRYVLALTMHHIISDGWSLEVLKDEFFHLYQALRAGGQPGLKPLRVQYKDYAAWHNRLLADEEKMQGAKEYWKSRSRDFSVLNLPYDRPKSKQTGKDTAGYRFALQSTTVQSLAVVGRQQKASLFMVLVAGLDVLLSHISGQEDIVIAVPGAARQHEDLKQVIGYFVNTLVIRSQVKPGDTFNRFLDRVRDNTLQVLEYQDYPMERIFDELNMNYPEISVFFNMSSFAFMGEGSLERFDSYHLKGAPESKFDLVFYVREYENGIEIECHYFRQLFNPETIEKMMTIFKKVLEGIAADPGKTVKEYGDSRKKRKLKLR